MFFLAGKNKRQLVSRIKSMSQGKKARRLNELLEPFGFFYDPSMKIISSALEAWQREFGYSGLYDRSAVYFNMVLDCEPVYFDYQGKTWMIEFWKGQYGINTGGEVGIYRAKGKVEPWNYGSFLFESVGAEEMLPVSMSLFYKGRELFSIEKRHWWLTGFCVGHFCEPRNLEMRAAITFPDSDMLKAFVKGLEETGQPKERIFQLGTTAAFCFKEPGRKQAKTLPARFSQLENKIFCTLYRLVTYPFIRTEDRLLYLYGLVPFAFRHMLSFKKNKGQRQREGKK